MNQENSFESKQSDLEKGFVEKYMELGHLAQEGLPVPEELIDQIESLRQQLKPGAKRAAETKLLARCMREEFNIDTDSTRWRD